MTDNWTYSKEEMVEEYHHSTFRKFIVFLICIVGIFLTLGLLSLTTYSDITIVDAYRYIWGHITGAEYELRSFDWWADWYIWNVAMVHAVVAILTGASLACCGALMQSLMNNPLADPYSTGISSGACLGAMASIITGLTVGSLTGTTGTIVNAFIGAMVPAVIIIIIAERIRMTPATLILMGTALSMFFSSFMAFLMVTTDADTLQNAYYWMVGNFSNISWSNIPFMAISTIGGSILVMFLANKLNVMSLGDSTAQSLGIDVRKFRTLSLTLMALMTAAIVSFVGIIGFVGLVCPHIVRLIIGSDNKFVIPIAMSMGALLILISDYISMSFGNIAVGVVISAIGAPLFFILILRAKSSGKGAIY